MGSVDSLTDQHNFHVGEAAIYTSISKFSLLLSCPVDKEFSSNETLKFIDTLFLLHNLVIILSLHFVPGLQAAFCTDLTKAVLLFFSVTKGRSSDFYPGNSGVGGERQKVLAK